MTIGVWGERKLADALESHGGTDEYGNKENVETILLHTKTFPENEAEAMAFFLSLPYNPSYVKQNEILM